MGNIGNWTNGRGGRLEEGRHVDRQNVFIYVWYTCMGFLKIINIESKFFLQLTQNWQSSSSSSAGNKEARPPGVHAVLINMHPEELPLSGDVGWCSLKCWDLSASLAICGHLIFPPGERWLPVLLTIRLERCGIQSSLDISYAPQERKQLCK